VLESDKPVPANYGTVWEVRGALDAMNHMLSLMRSYSHRDNMFGACTCLRSERLAFMKELSWFRC
jgi:hypothetical protein